MSRTWMLGAALVGVLALPVMSLAHGGHTHKVMGTVTAVTPTQLEVKGTDGKTVVLTLNARTVYRNGKVKAEPNAMKVGDRVVVDAEQPANAKFMNATVVQMAAPTSVTVKHASKP